jgi:CheY-like chemotaxis protein
MKILVVDDSSTDRRVLIGHLKALAPNAVIIESDDAAKAHELASQHRPDLICLDIIMATANHGVDGRVACKAIKADPALAMIPVVLVTSLSSAADKTVGTKVVKANAYLTKPVKADDVATALGQWIK